VIRWADISRERLALVATASAASTALYFYDYAYGFSVLLAFSLAHIVLEFPLNSMALRQLAGGDPPAASQERLSAARLSAATRPPRRAEVPAVAGSILRPLTEA
jgi:hypothetical protein